MSFFSGTTSLIYELVYRNLWILNHVATSIHLYRNKARPRLQLQRYIEVFSISNEMNFHIWTFRVIQPIEIIFREQNERNCRKEKNDCAYTEFTFYETLHTQTSSQSIFKWWWKISNSYFVLALIVLSSNCYDNVNYWTKIRRSFRGRNNLPFYLFSLQQSWWKWTSPWLDGTEMACTTFLFGITPWRLFLSFYFLGLHE